MTGMTVMTGTTGALRTSWIRLLADYCVVFWGLVFRGLDFQALELMVRSKESCVGSKAWDWSSGVGGFKRRLRTGQHFMNRSF